VHDTGEAHGQAPGRMGELLGQFSVATFKTSEHFGGLTHSLHARNALRRLRQRSALGQRGALRRRSKSGRPATCTAQWHQAAN